MPAEAPAPSGKLNAKGKPREGGPRKRGRKKPKVAVTEGRLPTASSNGPRQQKTPLGIGAAAQGILNPGASEFVLPSSQSLPTKGRGTPKAPIGNSKHNKPKRPRAPSDDRELLGGSSWLTEQTVASPIDEWLLEAAENTLFPGGSDERLDLDETVGLFGLEDYLREVFSKTCPTNCVNFRSLAV